MSIEVNVQYATVLPDLPNENELKRWAESALDKLRENVELTIRIVDEEEGKALNERWRKSKGPTNVLSFTHGDIVNGDIENLAPDLLGDVVICAPVVEYEAKEQNKDKNAHWAHMVIHGILHLIGYDHIDPEEAEHMENLEINILEKLNYKNPYLGS